MIKKMLIRILGIDKETINKSELEDKIKDIQTRLWKVENPCNYEVGDEISLEDNDRKKIKWLVSSIVFTTRTEYVTSLRMHYKHKVFCWEILWVEKNGHRTLYINQDKND